MKKPDYQLEYVYNKSRFNMTIWWCVIFWVLTRTARFVMYYIVGVLAFGAIPASFLFFFGGLAFGIALAAIVVYHRSARVEDIETEITRLQK